MASLKDCIKEIDTLKEKFVDIDYPKDDSTFMPGGERIIYNNPDFIKWKAKVLLTLEDYKRNSLTNQIITKLNGMNSWNDESDLNEIKLLLIVLEENDPHKFDCLKDKDIYAILDGDKNFGETDEFGETISISLPYLTKSQIENVCYKFNVKTNDLDFNQSRWVYVEELVEQCIENNKINELFVFLFSKPQFSKKLNSINDSRLIDKAYTNIIEKVLIGINSLLYFKDVRLDKIGDNFSIKNLNESVDVETPLIKNISKEYISDLSKRAIKDIDDGNYDSAITKSRSLLEEVFCHVIEKEGQTPTGSGDFNKLYNQVTIIYGDLKTGKDVSEQTNKLLSGLHKILDAIAEMRNEGSDSHGVGSRRIVVDENQARLFVNTSAIVSEYILGVCNNTQK